MSQKYSFLNNSIPNVFFHSLKYELTHPLKFTTREKEKQAIFGYIKVFHNRERVHTLMIICRQSSMKRQMRFFENEPGKVLTDHGRWDYWSVTINRYHFQYQQKLDTIL